MSGEKTGDQEFGPLELALVIPDEQGKQGYGPLETVLERPDEQRKTGKIEVLSAGICD